MGGAHTACIAHTTWKNAQHALGTAPNTMHNMFPVGVLPETSLTRSGAEGATSPLAEIPAFPCGIQGFLGCLQSSATTTGAQHTPEKYSFSSGKCAGNTRISVKTGRKLVKHGATGGRRVRRNASFYLFFLDFCGGWFPREVPTPPALPTPPGKTHNASAEPQQRSEKRTGRLENT